MDHIVYLDHKAKELDHFRSGLKSQIIRAAMGRKLPYGRVFKGDVLYFVENKGDGLVKAKAVVDEVYQSEKLSPEESAKIIEEHQSQLVLNEALIKRFSGKRYVVLITVKAFETLEPFQFDRTAYGNMDDWLPVENIENVKL